MKIRTRLLLLLLIVIVMFLTGLLCLNHWEEKKSDQFLQEIKKEFQANFTDIIDLKGETLAGFVNDYTYWDEMVEYLNTRDKIWARQNLNELLKANKFDALWILGIDGEMVYSRIETKTAATADIPFSASVLKKIFAGKRRYCHFFIWASTTIMEVRGATIHPTADVQRETPPRGFMLVGKLWDRNYIQDISRLVRSTVTIVATDDGESADRSPHPEKGIISFSNQLQNWDNRISASVTVRSEFTPFRIISQRSRQNILLNAGFGLLLLIIITVSLVYWIDIPLSLISRSLRSENPALITRMGRKSSEFGRLADLILKFFNQKRELTNEISTRREAESALRQSEELFRLMTENSLVGVYIIQNEKFLYANPTLVRMFGYSTEEITGRLGPADLTHSDELEKNSAVFRKRMNDNEVPSYFKLKMRRKDGSDFLSESLACSIEYHGQLAYIGTMADVTERDRAEEALKESETKYRNLVERANDGIAIIQDSIVRYANPSLLALWGKPDETILGSEFTRFIYPTEIAKLSTFFRERMSGKDAPSTYETLLRNSDGEGVPCEMNVSLISYQGKPAAMVMIHDISERKMAETAVTQAERKYRNIFENAMEGIFQIFPDGRIMSANPALARILGFDSPDALMGRVADFTLLFSDPSTRLHFLHMMKTRQLIKTYETQFIHENGQTIWISINASAVDEVDEGRLPYYEGMVEDISERKRLEGQLMQAQKMEAVGRLAGGIAHDFNNLLTIIQGYAEILLSQFTPDQVHHQNVNQIAHAAERAGKLTQQLLTFSRRQIIQIRRLDLNALIREMESMLKRLIPEDIVMTTILDSSLDRIKADPNQIEQMVMNLALNARDAMAGGGELFLETKNILLDADYQKLHPVVKTGAYVMLAISDTGAGMDKKTQSHIFEPFFTTKEKGKGTGLGLATVYGIVKQNGGYIWVYSELGKGSTFKVYFPAVSEQTVVTENFPLPVSISKGSETILVTEDNEGVRKLACEILETRGYRILNATNSAEARSLCQQHEGPIHLLLTDVIMPEISGPDLAKILKLLRPEMKVLYMSGYTDDMIVQQGILDEGIAFIQKPFTADDLARKVRETLDSPAPAGLNGLTPS